MEPAGDWTANLNTPEASLIDLPTHPALLAPSRRPSRPPLPAPPAFSPFSPSASPALPRPSPLPPLNASPSHHSPCVLPTFRWGTRWGEAGFFNLRADCTGYGALGMYSDAYTTVPIRG